MTAGPLRLPLAGVLTVVLLAGCANRRTYANYVGTWIRTAPVASPLIARIVVEPDGEGFIELRRSDVKGRVHVRWAVVREDLVGYCVWDDGPKSADSSVAIATLNLDGGKLSGILDVSKLNLVLRQTPQQKSSGWIEVITLYDEYGREIRKTKFAGFSRSAKR